MSNIDWKAPKGNSLLFLAVEVKEGFVESANGKVAGDDMLLFGLVVAPLENEEQDSKNEQDARHLQKWKRSPQLSKFDGAFTTFSVA